MFKQNALLEMMKGLKDSGATIHKALLFVVVITKSDFSLRQNGGDIVNACFESISMTILRHVIPRSEGGVTLQG